MVILGKCTCHGDCSTTFVKDGRLQSVKKEHNPFYYKLIQTFEEKTGIPILCSPGGALGAFLRTRMDAGVWGRSIINRK